MITLISLRQTLEGEETTSVIPAAQGVARVTADGTYATQSALSSVAKHNQEKPQLRQLLLDGEFFVGAALATALTKLSLRYHEVITV